ncbi:UPF0182 family membrane protein [Desulfosporosinus shakirovi]|uniref:UPF0182 family membrane protein n=1 Tax=Desulfosporosinus shakirovi TaxID=2885154 RepID=UPI001E33283D|nr:UPF0182 family protein [Desulfosporosinus sp. SRJS8]MCB8815019.1 UPF0182 family protein [Desulfosporosinus sp. SRJS8]
MLDFLKKYKLPLILVALVIFLVITITYYTNYLWYQSLGISQVFLKPLLSELGIKSLLWLLGFAFLLVNLLPMAGQFRIKPWPKVSVITEIRPRVFNLSKMILVIIAFILSIFWIWALPQMWDKVLLLFNSVPTGQADPILGRDLSYYLFQYPLYSLLSAAFISLLSLTITAMLVGYGISSAINFAGRRTKLSPKALAHFSILLGIFMLWYALTRGLSMAGLLISPSPSLYGAGYTDANITLPLMQIERILGALLALLLFANIRLKKIRFLIGAPALLLIVSLTGGIVGGAVNQFIVGPNQLSRETPYLQHHIQATRDAYKLSSIEEVDYSINTEEISSEILKANQATIDNIRLLDYRPLKQHYQQNQSLRLYYEFNDIDIDRYQIGNKSSQVMLSVRELNIDSLPETAQTLINRHFKYTHGYGIVMSPVNKITANGHPTYYLRDIPVKSDVVDIPLTQPDIYFGEMTNDFIVVGTESGEFGYTEDAVDEKSIVHYSGKDGVELSFFRRVMYAINFAKPILIFSDQITSESRILYNRNIVDRINKVAPFIELDSNAYPVISEGKVYWIVDGYTTSSNYPYAEPSGKLNYIRNSVKIVIDAYNGDVGIYNFDVNDPILKAWEGVFPDLIKSREEFPQGLESHIRYPADYFNIQSGMLRNYHMTNPRDFYNRENVWEIPTEKYSGEEVPVEPYYVTMQLPDSDKAEFILKQPFTPYNRRNMVGWLAAGNDGDSYGKLLLFSFPRGQQIEGPSQVDAYIDQDPVISQQLSLWSQGGSNVVRGNLLTIPINNKILYVEPLFILSDSGSIPELRRVILYYNDTLIMESTLDLALTKLFGEFTEDKGATVPDTSGTAISLQELATKINEALVSQEQAAREGRWADFGTYGEQIKELMSTLTELVKK